MGLFDGIVKAWSGDWLGALGSAVDFLGDNAVGAGSAYAAYEGQQQANEMNYRIFKEGSDFNADQALKQREFAHTEAWRNREWSENMAGSAYQRQVKDLEAAGLNPMLAYRSGGAATPPASTPSGSSASAAASPRMESPSMGAVTTALSAARTSAEVNLVKEQANKVKAETRVAESQALVNEVVARRGETEIVHNTSSARNLDARTADAQWVLRHVRPEERDKLISEIFRLNAQGNTEQERTKLTYQQWLHEIERRSVTRAESQLKGLSIPKARNEAAAEESMWKKNVSPYIGDVQSLTSSAASAARAASPSRVIPIFKRGK